MSHIVKFANAAIDPAVTKSIGSLEFGLFRKRSNNLFTQSTSALSKRLLKDGGPDSRNFLSRLLPRQVVLKAPPILAMELPASHAVSHDFLNNSLKKLLAQSVLVGGSDKPLSDEIFQKAMSFDPLQYINSTGTRTPDRNAESFQHWQIVMTALGLPGGKDWLAEHGATLPSDAGQLQHMVELARSCLEMQKRNGFFPDIVVPTSDNMSATEMDTAKIAGIGAAAGLIGNTSEYDSRAWAINALRNHLDPVKHSAEFLSIDQRLLKVGVWARRCTYSGTVSRILPMLKKSPFRALRFGVLGADLSGTESEVVRNQKIEVSHASHEQILGVLHHVVDRIQGASRLKLFNGGGVALSTRGLSVGLTQLATLLIMRIKFGILGSRLRTAGLELAMPPYNMELLIYSSRGGSLQGEVGVGVGPDLGLAYATAGGDIVPLNREKQESEGIVLRMPRIRGQEEQLRINFKAMLTDLLEWSTQADADKNAQPGDVLKRLLGKYPELSVSPIDRHKQKRSAYSGGFEIAGGIQAFVARFSASADVRLEKTLKSKRVYADMKGAIHVSKKITGQQLKGSSNVEAGIRSIFTDDDTRYNSPGMGLWGKGVDWLTAGRDFRKDTVYNDGLLHSMSFMEAQYQSFHDFESSVLENLDHWVAARARQKKIDPPLAEQQIRDFLLKVRPERNTLKIYAARAEVKEDVQKKVNKTKALIGLLKHQAALHSEPLVIKLESDVQAILDDPRSYEPTSFRVYQREDKSKSPGLRAVLHTYALTGAEGVHAQARLM